MLRAISVYECLPNNELKKIQSAPATSTGSFFRSGDELDKFESITLPKYPAEVKGKIAQSKVGDEFHYIKKQMDHVSKKYILMAIVSRTRWTLHELTYLFVNIYNVQTRPVIVKTTLNDILINPIGYTGRDIFNNSLKHELAEVKSICLENIEKVISRGEAIDALNDKAIDLAADALKFEKKAARLNRCCK